ncbi:DUF1266 domain-containing protein [Gordonia malaquae]|uniref:DUF1266 domain-containing protein n=1 Tax=Gordonia TaxID=2053 RepID=UPI0030C79FDD
MIPRHTPLPDVPAVLRAHATSTITVDPTGPLYDDLAQALALGAVVRVDERQPWNSLDVADVSTYSARVFLAEHGINSADDWTAALGEALNPSGNDIDSVLGFRADLMRTGETPTTGRWRAEMHEWLHDTDQTDDAHDAVDRIITAVDDIETMFTSAGLLEPGIKIRSVAGHRLSWAVSVARWGSSSGYGDYQAVRQALLAVRDLAGRHFVDWNEYAASTIAGFALEADDHTAAITTYLPPVATLLVAADSPWRNLTFPTDLDFAL